MPLLKTIETEIQNYIGGEIDISPDVTFSQYETIKRIILFQNRTYPTGNVDSQGNYKYYYDIISPRIDNEIKNIDFDTKNIFLYSDKKEDSTKVFLANSKLRDYLKDSEQAVKLNDAVEMFSGMGNVVFKKLKEGYELWNPLNFFVINQAAKTLEDTKVIERHILNATQLMKKKDIWDSDTVDLVIKNCGNKGFELTENESTTEDTETQYYEIYELNGQISIEEYKEAKGEEILEGDDEKYMLAKVIFAGLDGKAGEGDEQAKYILFADEIKKMSDVYVEVHRGRYQGRWFRTGLYETLFDIQIRSNAIGNEIARALEFGGKQFFWSPDSLIYKNIMTDMQRGDIVQTSKIDRIPTEMRDISNYIQEWNLWVQLADRLANSFEVSQGESMPSGTPFRLGAMLNINANKLFDFIREKLGLGLKEVFANWIIPDLLKDLKASEVLKLTDDPEYIKRYKEILVDSWYMNNLLSIGAHTPEMAMLLKQGVMEKLNKEEGFFIDLEKGMWKDFEPELNVVITGENVNIEAENTRDISFIQLEADPIRRTALLEEIYARNGKDISTLPKSAPENIQPVNTQGRSQPVQTEAQPQTL